jgi:hypothetical protein
VSLVVGDGTTLVDLGKSFVHCGHGCVTPATLVVLGVSFDRQRYGLSARSPTTELTPKHCVANKPVTTERNVRSCVSRSTIDTKDHQDNT